MKKINIKNTDEFVYLEKLDNGLDIIMIPNPKVKNFYCTLNVKFGSIYTNFKYLGKNFNFPKGVAHFLEHLMFNMPDGTNAFEYYSKLGSNINAFTTYEYTSYEVFANNKFKENLSYLLKYVYTPYFTKEMINNEKGIIIEEINMISDNPISEIVYGLYRNIFINDERQYLIAGTISDIKNITLEDITTAYDAFYHPENMFLVITGNFNPTEAVAIASETMKKIDFIEYCKPIIKKKKEPTKVKNELEEKDIPVDKYKVILGLKIPKNKFKNINISELEIKIYLNLIIRINFGGTSLLKEELLKSKIITDSISTNLTVTEDYFIIAFLTTTDYPDYFLKRIKEKLNNLTINEDDINRKVKSSISNLILSFDEIEAVNNDVQDDMIYQGKYIDNIYDYYRNINISTANQVLKKITLSNFTVNILKPKSDK